MEPANSAEKNPPTLQELFPHLRDFQLKEAAENLDRYLELALRIYERLLLDPEGYARFQALTKARLDPKICDKGRVKRSKSNA